MKFKPCASLLSAALIAATSSLGTVLPKAFAEESRTAQSNLGEEKGEVSESAQGVRDLALAYSLVTYRRQNQGPQPPIAAAKIIMNIPVQSLTRDKTSETDASETAPEGEKTNADSLLFSADTLLGEARTLAQGESKLLVSGVAWEGPLVP